MRDPAEIEPPILTLLLAWATYHTLRMLAKFKPRHPSAVRIAADTAGTGNPPGA
ncbi:MAG: hypothetical protein ACTHM2_14865 [Afipia sp.]|jgi:hypothetical protein